MRPGFRMTVGGEPGGVARVGAAFAEFAEAHGLPDAVRRSLQVALDELLRNTVAYGLAGPGGGGGGGQVTVEVELGPDRVSVTLTDDGRPFDPLAVPPPDTGLSLEERRIGGLGIHLVRQLMDEVRYARRENRNVVILTKHLVEDGP